MKMELYYEQGLSGETERFQEFCTIQEYRSTQDFAGKRALFLSRKGLGLITPGFGMPLYIKENKKSEKPFRSNLVRACIPKEKRFSGNYSILDAFSGFGSDTMTLALTNNPVTSLEKDPLVGLFQKKDLLMGKTHYSCVERERGRGGPVGRASRIVEGERSRQG